MTKEQYEKWSAPYRRGKSGVKFLIRADKIMTAAIFVAYPMLLLYLFYLKDFKSLFYCILIPAVSYLLVSLFRRIYSAPRPYEVWDISPLIPKDTKGKSFPSRHVFSIFIIGMTFFYVIKPLGIVIGILGIGMAYVRVVGGVHFPKDVAAGALIGILWGMLYYYI